MKLDPQAINTGIVSTFKIDVRVAPNGRQVSRIQTTLEFDPDQIQVTENGVTLNESLPLASPDGFPIVIDNDLGVIFIAAEATAALPVTGFTVASAAFRLQSNASGETIVELGLGSEVKSGEVDATGNTESQTVITVQGFNPF